MKGLILKDFYNVNKYLKSMLLMIIIMAIMTVKFDTESFNVSGIVAMSGILYAMTIFTTFSFDDTCEWNKFALISPVTKKDIVKAKFISLVLFCLIGVLVGTIIAIGTSLAFGKFTNIKEELIVYSILVIISLSISSIFGSTSIPFVYKIGVEKARNYLILTYIIPIGVFFLIYKILTLFGVVFTEELLVILGFLSPIIAIIWIFIMYKISIKFFDKEEF